MRNLLRLFTLPLFFIGLAACDSASTVVVTSAGGANDTTAPNAANEDSGSNGNGNGTQPQNTTGVNEDSVEANETGATNEAQTGPGNTENQDQGQASGQAQGEPLNDDLAGQGNTAGAQEDSGQNPSAGSGPQNNQRPDASADAEPAPDPFNAGSFELRLDATRFELIEANENGITVPINISRIDSHIRTVRITVSPQNERDAHRLDARLEHEELVAEQTHTSWRAELGVSVAPLQFHERVFVVNADDGRSQESQTFTVDVRPISAPDVYLLIGQSNMEGSSELGARDTSPGGADALNPRIRQLNVRQNDRTLFDEPAKFTDAGFNTLEPRYITAEDPLHEPRFSFRSEKDGSFIGLGLSFAKAALVDTSNDIVLVPAAWSARGFCANDDPELAWNAVESDEQALGGTLLADRAITRLNTALTDTGGVLRGILWHQGEADSNTTICAERYENNVVSLVNRIKREASVDARGEGARGDNAAVPFILGTMSRGRDERGDFSQYSAIKQRIDNTHRNLPNILPLSDIAIGDDLVPAAFPCGQSSCVHFGAAAYRELGDRYYQALKRIINSHP